MGAWGTQLDESDGSLDFLADVERSRDWSVVAACITDYVANGGFDDGEDAWAALELVAAANGRPSSRLDAELSAWAAENLADADRLGDLAREAVALLSGASELSELWAESDEAADWQAVIADLRARLRA